MEFGKAFTYAFEDPEWIKKLLIAALILLIPIIGIFVVMGWMLEIIRRVIQHDPHPLPDWSDFGGYLVRGFQAWLVGLVYALPIILISFCQQGAFFALQESGDDTLMSAVAFISICVSCLIFIYSLAMSMVLPAALGQFATTGQLGSAFRFGEVFGLVRAAPGAFLLVLVGSFVAGLIASLGIILCFIGVLFTSALAYAIMAHLYGQAYNVAVAQKAVQA
jgi:hypothetical protein